MTTKQTARNLTAIDTAWAIEQEEIRKEQEHPLRALVNTLRYIFHGGSADHRYPKKVVQAIKQAKEHDQRENDKCLKEFKRFSPIN